MSWKNRVAACAAIAAGLGTAMSNAPAATVLSEDWNGAAVGVLSPPGPLAADNSWDLSVIGTPGTAAVITESPGDEAVAHTVSGSGGSSRFYLQTALTTPVDLDTHRVSIEFDATFNEVLSTGNRHTLFQLFNVGGTGDGYQVRLTASSAVDTSLLDIAAIDNGTPGSATDLLPIPAGQTTAKLYRARITLEKTGTGTQMAYEVENLTDGGFIVPAQNTNFPAIGVDSGTILTHFRLGFRLGSRVAIDNILVTSQSTDSVPPVITRTGPAEITLNCGDSYTDEGATATDNVDGNITANIVTVNPVNTNAPAVYTITYNVSDAAGNPAVEVTRTVTVLANCADVTPPVITLNGVSPAEVNCGATYTDAGATASDDTDGNITSRIAVTNPVNTAEPGTYIVRYNVTDLATNAAEEVTRTVVVLDNCPLITIEGPQVVTAGDNVTLTVVSPPLVGALSYTWLKDGEVLPGESNSTLFFSRIRTNQSGGYQVIVTDESKATYPPSPIFDLFVEPNDNLPIGGPLALLLLSAAFITAGIANRKK